MEAMLNESGLDHFAEIGTGKVLAGLMKRAARDRQREVQIVNVENMADLKKNG